MRTHPSTPTHLHTHPNHQIRAIAAELDLPTKARKDSQGICFLGKLRWVYEYLSVYVLATCQLMVYGAALRCHERVTQDNSIHSHGTRTHASYNDNTTQLICI